MTIDMTFEAREKIIRRDEFAAGRAEGIAEGRTEGLEDALRKIVQINMDKGRTVEEIAEITGESVKTVRLLLNEV